MSAAAKTDVLASDPRCFGLRRPADGDGYPLGELWAYRELLYFLIWREIKIRYKQTAIGAAWAVLQPFLTMLVFALFFGKLGTHFLGRAPVPNFLLQRASPVDVLRLCPSKCDEHNCG